MDDPGLVRRFQRVSDLLRDRQRLGERYRSPRNHHRQIVAFDQLHHECAHTTRVFEPVNVRDVRVVQ